MSSQRTTAPLVPAVQFFVTGREMYPVWEKYIREAKSEILLNTYSFDYDAVGVRLVNMLRERAAAGVRVRIIFDALESERRGQPVLDAFAGSRVEVKAYRPFRYLRRRPVSFLYRNHARLFLIDRQILGVGGMSIGNIYLDRRDSFLFLRVREPAGLTGLFEKLWQAADNPVQSDPALAKRVAPGVELLISGPRAAEQDIYTWRMRQIQNARARIDIVTSFFFPTREMTKALISAQKRGVRVMIVTPFQTDKGHYDSFRSIPIAPLLTEGVEWYATPFYFHTKFMLCDEAWNVGSANCDIISMRRNYELDLAGSGGPILSVLEQNLRALTAGVARRTKQPKYFFFRELSRLLYGLFEFFFTAYG